MSSSEHTPLILERSKHPISRSKIDPDALKVMYRLINHGYQAYLVGGGVRDLLLGKEPKDYDVGTDAKTEVVRSLFRNSRIIGRRFKLNQVYFRGNKIIEVSTFRALSTFDDDDALLGPVKVDNTYGDACSDALRRDLTINGLFYDLKTYSVIDYVGGLEDLRNGIIRIIGHPETRIQEDPVRMLRAVRHAARAGFRIEPLTWEAILQCAPLLANCSQSRVSEEFLRDLRGGAAQSALKLMAETGILRQLFPLLAELLLTGDQALRDHLDQVLARLDAVSEKTKEQYHPNKEIPAGIILAALMMGTLPQEKSNLGLTEYDWCRAIPYFQLRPEPQELQGVEIQQVKMEAAPSKAQERGGRGGRRYRRQQAVVSALSRLIDKVFLAVGLSRRERERMEHLLALRLSVLTQTIDPAHLEMLTRDPLGRELLLLEELSGSGNNLGLSLEDEIIASNRQGRRRTNQHTKKGLPQNLSAQPQLTGRPRRRRRR